MPEESSARGKEGERKTNISIISSKINYCNHINSRGYRERERGRRPADWGKNDQWSSKLNIRKFSVDFYSVHGKGEMGEREREGSGYGLHISLANQDANLKKINSCATSRSCDLSARGFRILSGLLCDYNLIFQDERRTISGLVLLIHIAPTWCRTSSYFIKYLHRNLQRPH